MSNLEQLLQQLEQQTANAASPHDQIYDYHQLRQQYERQANNDVRLAQQHSRLQRIEQLHQSSEIDPKWRFDTLIQDADDVTLAISTAKSFIAAHQDPDWRNEKAHMLFFYGDYGRGKSHLAGAIANDLIETHEISALYQCLPNVLESRNQSLQFQRTDGVAERFNALNQQLLNVELLILDEVCINETYLSKNAQSFLGNLLRKRYLTNKNCILITNHNLPNFNQAVGAYCFESVMQYDPMMVEFSGPSRRQKANAIGLGYTPNT